MKDQTFFTSDWHLFHANIIKYSARPFKDTVEMNRAIQDRINEKVDEKSWLYFLGDAFFAKNDYQVQAFLDWLDGLKCKNLCWIKGNHDRRRTTSVAHRFFWVKDMAEIEIEGQKIVLNHYAMKVWNKSHRGAWHLYGHSHGSLPDDPNSLSFDVGVDTNNFYPYSFHEVEERMKKKKFVPIDHHKGNYEK